MSHSKNKTRDERQVVMLIPLPINVRFGKRENVVFHGHPLQDRNRSKHTHCLAH